MNDRVVQALSRFFLIITHRKTGRRYRSQRDQRHSKAACSCALVGGETAEMPGINTVKITMWRVVGVVEKSEIIDGSKVTDGDVLVALSSGPHSNGYSLVRKIMRSAALTHKPPTLTVNRWKSVLAPTRM